MKTEVIVATGNEGKVRELNRLFSESALQFVSMKDWVPEGFEVEETGTSFEENAWLKATETCKISGKPALADDSGLEVDVLGGRPGIYSARYAGEQASDDDNNALLLRELGKTEAVQRRARFRCVLALAAPPLNFEKSNDWRPQRIASAAGTLEGRILLSPRGDNGFGYDPLFEPLCRPGLTTAEIPSEEKNDISHRAEAARVLLPKMEVWLAGLVRS